MIFDPLRLQRANVVDAAERLQYRSLTFDETYRAAESVGDDQDVAEQDGGIRPIAAHGLQRRFDRQVRSVAEPQEVRLLFAQASGTPAGIDPPDA